MADYSLALQVKPPSVDVATPLLTAAKIRASDMENQQRASQMKQEALGQEFRGLAAVADSPEFPQRWAEAHDRLAQQGLITPQAHAQLRDNPSMLILKQGLAATQTPDVALRQQALEETKRQHTQTFGLEREKFMESVRQHGAAEEKPVIVSPGAQLVNPKNGRSVFSNEAGLLDAEALKPMIDQYRRGDRSVLNNIGRGTQGAANIVRFRSELAKRLEAEGMTGADQAAAIANFSADAAAARTAAVRQANVDTAFNEALQTFPLVLEASNALSRTDFVPYNKLVQMVRAGTSNVAQGQLAVALQGAITAYSQAMSRTGINTVHAQQRAEELLSSVTSKEELAGRIAQMRRELDAAKSAPEQTRRAIEGRITGKGETVPAATEPAVPGNPGYNISASVPLAPSDPAHRIDRMIYRNDNGVQATWDKKTGKWERVK